MPTKNMAFIPALNQLQSSLPTRSFGASSLTPSISSISSIPIPHTPASLQRRRDEGADLLFQDFLSLAGGNKRKRLDSSFTVGSPTEKRPSVLPTPPLSEDIDSLPEHNNLFNTPPTPPTYITSTASPATILSPQVDLFKGLGINLIHESSQIITKSTLIEDYDEEDRTFLFDEEVGVGESRFEKYMEDEDEIFGFETSSDML